MSEALSWSASVLFCFVLRRVWVMTVVGLLRCAAALQAVGVLLFQWAATTTAFEQLRHAYLSLLSILVAWVLMDLNPRVSAHAAHCCRGPFALTSPRSCCCICFSSYSRLSYSVGLL